SAAPIGFTTLKSMFPSMDDILLRPVRLDPALEKMLNPTKIEPILRYRRHADNFVRVVEHLARSSSKIDVGTVEDMEEENMRVKREYDFYDEVNTDDITRPSSKKGSSTRGRRDTTADDYYDQVDTARANGHRNSRPGRPQIQRNCYEFLG
ncbi:hypothetical protein PMAYCL1PPCAC_00314, partial [Pristionchus mayeri]